MYHQKGTTRGGGGGVWVVMLGAKCALMEVYEK